MKKIVTLMTLIMPLSANALVNNISIIRQAEQTHQDTAIVLTNIEDDQYENHVSYSMKDNFSVCKIRLYADGRSMPEDQESHYPNDRYAFIDIIKTKQPLADGGALSASDNLVTYAEHIPNTDYEYLASSPFRVITRNDINSRDTPEHFPSGDPQQIGDLHLYDYLSPSFPAIALSIKASPTNFRPIQFTDRNINALKEDLERCYGALTDRV